jgi:hypothetical protein
MFLRMCVHVCVCTCVCARKRLIVRVRATQWERVKYGRKNTKRRAPMLHLQPKTTRGATPVSLRAPGPQSTPPRRCARRTRVKKATGWPPGPGPHLQSQLLRQVINGRQGCRAGALRDRRACSGGWGGEPGGGMSERAATAPPRTAPARARLCRQGRALLDPGAFAAAGAEHASEARLVRAAAARTAWGAPRCPGYSWPRTCAQQRVLCRLCAG